MEASTPPELPFRITRQDHEPTYDPSNPGASQWTIYFRTRGGTDSFIVVPDSEYTADNIAAQLRQRAQLIDGIGAVGQAGE